MIKKVATVDAPQQAIPVCGVDMCYIGCGIDMCGV